jgi:diguanylate cyclase (GGDEF)-like protein
MIAIDNITLLLTSAFILLLLAVFTALAAFHEGRSHALLWMASGLLLAALGYMLQFARLINISPAFMVVWGNVALILSQACMWTNLRVFGGKAARWVVIVAGPLLWVVLCQWQDFAGSIYARIAGFSLISLVYILWTAKEVWALRFIARRPVLLLWLVLIEHALYYAYRLLPFNSAGITWFSPSISFTLFEGLLFSIGLAYGTLIVVRDAIEWRYCHASLHDPLTGLPNRRALFEKGKELLTKVQEQGGALAILMCDLDNFKRINDQYGHDKGDKVLVAFAGVLSHNLRQEDFCARMGGEEFVVIVQADSQTALQLAERIRKAFAQAHDLSVGQLGVSIGVADIETQGHNLDKLLSCADKAMYRAKESGRNCVRMAVAMDGL